jgi:hypothetical protein
LPWADAPQVNDKFILIEANTDDVNIDSVMVISGSDKTWNFSDLDPDNDEEDLDVKVTNPISFIL